MPGSSQGAHVVPLGSRKLLGSAAHQLVADRAVGVWGELEQGEVRALLPGGEHVDGAVRRLPGRHAVCGRLLVHLVLVGGEQERHAGCGDLGERVVPVLVDLEHVQLVQAAVADHDDVRAVLADLHAVEHVEVVEPARLVARTRRRRRVDVLHDVAVHVERGQAADLLRADDEAVGGVVGVDPHLGVVGVEVPAGVVVERRRGLHGGVCGGNAGGAVRLGSGRGS